MPQLRRPSTDDWPVRLDKWLVDHGLAQSRARAKAMIEEGKVRVFGCDAPKPVTPVGPDTEVTVLAEDIPWVSRGGLKLAAALAQWPLDVRNRVCLDVGASTGGFTDVLLHHGARRVYALDVGHGQLAEKLRSNPRVVSLEGVNARHIDPELLPGPVDFICVDVSFVSLTLILPAVVEMLVPGGYLVALIKPQFEVGKSAIGKGVVRDPAEHERVVTKIRRLTDELPLTEIGLIPSPILGAEGNREFLLCLKRDQGRSS